MEDPVRFTIWAAVRKGASREALEELMRRSPSARRMDLARAVNRSALGEEPVALVGSAGWSEVERVRAEPPPWATSLLVIQESNGSSTERLERCEVHDYWFAGCRGCHVCRGFFDRE